MVEPSMRRMLALARTSLLGATSTNSIQEILERSTPGFTFLQAFFSTWLKIDLTTLAAALTIFGTISGALQDLQGVALKIYWWITRFFTASVSVSSSDKLNKEVLNWLGDQVLTRQGTRILTARSEAVQNDLWHLRRGVTQQRNDYHHEKRVPIQYLPTFGTTWFIHEFNMFMIRRVPTRNNSMRSNAYGMGVPDEYAAAPEGDEPLVIMCLGRSVTPIKKFLNTCRTFADKQRENFITVRASKNKFSGELWDTTILRPIRPLETVHFDQIIKEELVTDIGKYLDPTTRQFYTTRGIPYRRGYLLHGPPGTGKTSLSLALAGYFSLELYILHIPSIREDNDLERLFTALPPRCIVLIEDIDAVGVKRQAEMVESDGDDIEDKIDKMTRSRCTLSGLLNVLDGVASQEGRIVLMTSNMADKLDSALVRPGRIDRMIFLGNISQSSAEKMFLRMFTPDRSHSSTLADTNHEVSEEDLQKLASEFGSQIPENTFTPAQLQGFLLDHRNAPAVAIAQFPTWEEEEKGRMEAAKLNAKEAAERKAKKRKEAKMNLLAKTMMGRDLGMDFQRAANIAKDDVSGETKEEGPIKRPEKQEATPEEKVARETDGVAEAEKAEEDNMGRRETNKESKPAEDTKIEAGSREIR